MKVRISRWDTPNCRMRVYVQDVADEIPGYPRGYAYGHSIQKYATLFDREEAERLIADSWPHLAPEIEPVED